MDKLRKLSFKRAFAGVGAFAILGIAVMSTAMSLLALRPASVEAQGAVFTWVNAATIRIAGGTLYTDSNPWDENFEYLPSNPTQCSYNNKTVLNDRIVVDHTRIDNPDRFADHPTYGDTRPKRINPSGATRTQVTDAKNALQQPVCDTSDTRLSGANVFDQKMVAYREGDTLRSVASGVTKNNGPAGAVTFVKTGTTGLSGSNNIEIFVREGEQAETCKDVILHGTDGPYNGWFGFPMAEPGKGNADGKIRSEQYNSLFPGVNCMVAPDDISEDWKMAVWDGKKSSVLRKFLPYWDAAFGDDAYKMQAAPGTTETNGNDPDAQPKPEGVTKRTACDLSFDFVNIVSLKWLVCPVVDIAMSTVSFLEDFLVGQLKIETASLQAGSAYHKIWSNLSYIGYGVIIFAALVLVAFRAAGIESMSAYTERSLFTALGVALVAITLSWPAAGALADIINGINEGARTLIYAPFNAALPNTTQGLGGGSSIMLFLLGTGAAIALGPWGLLTFVLSAVLSIGLAVLVITLAKSVFIMAVIFSPVWIAAKTMKFTEPVYNIGKGALVSSAGGLTAVAVLLPLIDAMAEVITAGGGVINQLLGLGLKLGRVLLILWIFSRIGGAMATVTGMVNDRGRGMFDRLKNARGNQMASRHEQLVKGQRKLFGANGLTSAYQRVAAAKDGGLSVTRRGRARYGAQRTEMAYQASQESLKRDDGRFSGDDTANHLLSQDGMTESKFVNDYARIAKVSAQQAQTALAGIERSYGTKVGTNGMKVAAFKAVMSSKTGYDPDDKNAHNKRYREAVRLYKQGLITENDAIQAMGSAKERADLSGMGYGAKQKAFRAASETWDTGEREQVLNQSQQNALYDDVIKGQGPGGIIGSDWRTIKALAPAYQRQATEAVNSGDPKQVQRIAASVAAMHELSGQVSNANREQFGSILNDTKITYATPSGPEDFSLREFTEIMRDPNLAKDKLGIQDTSEYAAWKREFNTSIANQYNQQQQQAQQAAAGQVGQIPQVGGRP